MKKKTEGTRIRLIFGERREGWGNPHLERQGCSFYLLGVKKRGFKWYLQKEV